MKVALTGASGFLGRAVAARLAAAGHHVRALTRDGAPVPGAAEAVACGDLLAADHAALLAGCDAVVNCAARVHVLKREAPEAAEAAYRAMNRDLPLRLAEAARAAGVRRFVQLSSLAAVASATAPGEVLTDTSPPRPATPYGRAKLEADAALGAMSDAAFSIACLRPPVIHGPGAGAWFGMLAKAAQLGLPLPVGGIANARSFAFVGNMADAVRAALEGDAAGAFLVTDSAPLSTADLYRRLLALHGHGNRAWRWPAPLIELPARLLLGARAGSLLGNAAASRERFAATFGWMPPIPMDEALALTVGRAP